MVRSLHIVRGFCLVLLACACVSCGCRGRRGPDWAERELLRPFENTYKIIKIPSGRATLGSKESESELPPRKVVFESFWMANCEVTVSQYAEFMNRTENRPDDITPQVVEEEGQYMPRPGLSDHPVTFVSYGDAVAFCEWLSAALDRKVRLPSEDEWEYAARGGIRRAGYPWGYGEPYGRARYASASAKGVGSYDPNPYGLFDMAGNVFEWCALDASAGSVTQAYARGGSWAEDDPEMICVYSRSAFALDYRDADVGFRFVVEPEE